MIPLEPPHSPPQSKSSKQPGQDPDEAGGASVEGEAIFDVDAADATVPSPEPAAGAPATPVKPAGRPEATFVFEAEGRDLLTNGREAPPSPPPMSTQAAEPGAVEATLPEAEAPPATITPPSLAPQAGGTGLTPPTTLPTSSPTAPGQEQAAAKPSPDTLAALEASPTKTERKVAPAQPLPPSTAPGLAPPVAAAPPAPVFAPFQAAANGDEPDLAPRPGISGSKMSLSAEPVLTAPPQTPVAASILAAPATVYPLRFPDGKFSEKTEISVTQIDPNLPRTAVFQAPATAQTHDARHLVAQVVAQIVKGATGAVDIRLDPPELGRVSLTLSLGDDAVTAVIAADRADTQDLLRRHADMLQRALREAGYSDVSLDFSTSSNGGERPPSAPRAPEVTAGTPATDIKYAPKIVTNGLDIRV